jgi:hypothetical protein
MYPYLLIRVDDLTRAIGRCFEGRPLAGRLADFVITTRLAGRGDRRQQTISRTRRAAAAQAAARRADRSAAGERLSAIA